MEIGFLGLGKMGLNLALNLQEKGHKVVAWNRSESGKDNGRNNGLDVKESIADVVESLDANQPRVIWLMLSAGQAVDSVVLGTNDFTGLQDLLKPGDIVIEAANSHYKDSQRRSKSLAEKGISLIDLGVSGGVEGARNGICAMAGGSPDAIVHVQQLLESVCVPHGFGYFGESGAGHYVKMVHNAIEYGIMQSIAEGMNLLELSEYKVDLAKLTHVWNNGSIVQSRLLGFLHQALVNDPHLQNSPSEIGSLGTAKWAVIEALAAQAPLTSISNSVFARFESRQKSTFAHKVVQAMRSVFGGHSSQDRE